MKAWAMTLILASVIGALTPLFLPKGEKSPLYGAVKLVSALVFLLVLSGPLLSLLGQTVPASLDFLSAPEETYDPERLLLERSFETIEKNVRRLFPQGDYSLVFESDEENHVITAIRIQTDDRHLGEEIERFLQEEVFQSLW